MSKDRLQHILESTRAPPGQIAPRNSRALTNLLQAAWSEYERDYARYFAGAMVYYALVALMPVLLLMLAALGLLPRLSDLALAAEHRVLSTLEMNFGAELRSAMEGLLQQLQQGSVIATCISLVGLVLASSVLIRHLRMTFRAIWKHAPPLASGSVRGAVQATILERTIAFVMVLAGGGLLVAAFLLIGAVHWLIARFDGLPLFGSTMAWLLALSPLLIAPLTFGLLLVFLPPVRLPWRHVWLATLLCSAAWTVGTEILALYLAHFSGNFSAYGALGGLLIFMLWIHGLSKVLFFGGELSKVVHCRDNPRELA